MGSKPGGVAVSTEGRTWVELQVALDALPAPHRAIAVAMRQAAEAAPLLGLGRGEGVGGESQVAWLLSGRPAGNAKRLLGLAARHNVLQCVRTLEEGSALQAAVADATATRATGRPGKNKRGPSAAGLPRTGKAHVEQLDVVVTLAALSHPGAPTAGAGAWPAWPHNLLRIAGVLAASSDEAAEAARCLASMDMPAATLELFVPLVLLGEDSAIATAPFHRVTFVE